MSIFYSLACICALVCTSSAAVVESSSSSSSSGEEDPRLRVATFNGALFNDPTVDERLRIQQENLVTSLEEQDIQVVCLQEIGFFGSFQEAYQSFLAPTFPYQASSLDSFPSSGAAPGSTIPCSPEDVAAIQSECITDNCVLSQQTGGVTGFIYCIGAFCPDDFAQIYNTDCGGCAAALNFADPTLTAEEIIFACQQPSPFNYNLGGGLALVSQYPLNNVQIHALPSWVTDRDYLITADIEVPASKTTQIVTVGCLHAYSPIFLTSNGLIYYPFPFAAPDAPLTIADHFEFQTYQYEAVVDILDGLRDKAPTGQGQIILGDFNFEDGTTASSDLFTDAGFESIFDVLGDTVPDDCTFCPQEDVNDNTNICVDPTSSTNPLLVLEGNPANLGNRNIVDDVYIRNFGNKLRKRASDAGRFLEQCYDITIDGNTFPMTFSDHYGVFAKLRLMNIGLH